MTAHPCKFLYIITSWTTQTGAQSGQLRLHCPEQHMRKSHQRRHAPSLPRAIVCHLQKLLEWIFLSQKICSSRPNAYARKDLELVRTNKFPHQRRSSPPHVFAGGTSLASASGTSWWHCCCTVGAVRCCYICPGTLSCCKGPAICCCRVCATGCCIFGQQATVWRPAIHHFRDYHCTEMEVKVTDWNLASQFPATDHDQTKLERLRISMTWLSLTTTQKSLGCVCFFHKSVAMGETRNVQTCNEASRHFYSHPTST